MLPFQAHLNITGVREEYYDFDQYKHKYNNAELITNLMHILLSYSPVDTRRGPLFKSGTIITVTLSSGGGVGGWRGRAYEIPQKCFINPSCCKNMYQTLGFIQDVESLPNTDSNKLHSKW